MQTKHPVVVQRSYFVLVMAFIVGFLLLAVFIKVAWKMKKDKEQVAPVTPLKVMPTTVPAHQDRIVLNKDDGSVVVRTSFSFEVAKGTNHGPAVIPQSK
ncbi:MAG: hypothetical protein RLZZ347_73 [Candidatus Parcubacteria bacterium]|jgi:flagellar basal body-associated protein FliL